MNAGAPVPPREGRTRRMRASGKTAAAPRSMSAARSAASITSHLTSLRRAPRLGSGRVCSRRGSRMGHCAAAAKRTKLQIRSGGGSCGARRQSRQGTGGTAACGMVREPRRWEEARCSTNCSPTRRLRHPRGSSHFSRTAARAPSVPNRPPPQPQGDLASGSARPTQSRTGVAGRHYPSTTRPFASAALSSEVAHLPSPDRGLLIRGL
jgi:hypothetical protein